MLYLYLIFNMYFGNLVRKPCIPFHSFRYLLFVFKKVGDAGGWLHHSLNILNPPLRHG